MTLAPVVMCGILAICAQPDPNKTRVYKQAAEMDYGPCIAATVGIAKDNITPKGLVIRVDREKQAYVLFDTELLRVTAAWTGGWLQLAGRVYADDSNDYPWIGAEPTFFSPVGPGWAKGDSLADPRPKPGDGPLPADWARFKGLYLHGEKVVVSYTVGDVPILELFGLERQGDGIGFTRNLELGPTDHELTLVAAAEAPSGEGLVVAASGANAGVRVEVRDGKHLVHLPPLQARRALKLLIHSKKIAGPWSEVAAEPLEPLTQGGPAHWTESVTTKGVVGTGSGPYVVDTLTAPEQNPYKSWLRFTGIDFFPDGRAALCTWSGDVWIVSGIDAGLEKLTWKRYATGIGQPMGLKIVDGKILVTARDQITRLHDLNGDGEADYYECVNNGIKLTTNFHEFCFDLQTDAQGNFYCTKGSPIWAGSLRPTDHSGSVCKISKDGSTLEIVATGLRAPNGLGISPDGEVLCTDNQGNWVPECPINLIKSGGFYGFVQKGQPATEREKPITWIPMSVDKSSGGLVWVPDERWGLPKGSLVLQSYDCSVSLVLREKLSDGEQGGVVRFPLKFPSGVMRGRFNPVDGQLYVAGLRGWSSAAAKDCAFQRVRYAGGPVVMPLKVVTKKGGLEVTFSGALNPDSVADSENVGAVGFNVIRSGNYGSPEFSLKDPKKAGRDPVEIKSSKLLPDGRTVWLEMPELRVMTNLVLKFRLKAADGSPVQHELDYTLHQVPE
jgi:sugar lactone lactonase YvrE